MGTFEIAHDNKLTIFFQADLTIYNVTLYIMSHLNYYVR